MGIPQEDIQAASRRFYEAVEQVMQADATAMLTLWSEQNDVTYCDPSGHVHCGREALISYWQQAALKNRQAPGSVSATAELLLLQKSHEMVCIVLKEHIQVREQDRVVRLHALERQRLSAAGGAPVWMYRFDWESPAFGGVLGAAHAMDIPFVWNTLDMPLSRMFTGDSPARQDLSDLMHASWASFIRSGTPAISSLPAWPPYDLDRRATMLFGDVPRLVDDPQGQVRALWKQVL